MYFKWKPRSVRNGVIFMVAIPGALLYFLKKMEVSSLLVLFFSHC